MAFQSPADLTIKTERILLEKLFIGASARVSRIALSQLKRRHMDHTVGQGTLITTLEPMTDEMILYMQAWLFKSPHVETKTITVTVNVPATWVDHWKSDWLMSGTPWKLWIASRFAPPTFVPQTDSATYDAETRVCPHNDTYFSADTTHIKWLLYEYDERVNRGPYEHF